MKFNLRIMLLQACFLFAVSTISANSYATSDSGTQTELSILVVSCDKYAPLWPTFFGALHDNWPELKADWNNVDIYLIANQKNYPDPKVKMINIINEKSWSDNLIYALNKIDSKYILLFLEDYWVNTQVDQNRLSEILNYAKKHDVAYIQLYEDGNYVNPELKVSGIEGLVYKNKFQNFRASLQLALWETAALKQILRPGESAWDFEKAASIRSSGYPKDFLSLKANPPIIYINAMNYGHAMPQAVEFSAKHDEGFKTEVKSLQKSRWRLLYNDVRSRLKTLSAKIRQKVSKRNPNGYRYVFEEGA